MAGFYQLHNYLSRIKIWALGKQLNEISSFFTLTLALSPQGRGNIFGFYDLRIFGCEELAFSGSSILRRVWRVLWRSILLTFKLSKFCKDFP
jgi:hypothetical protein